MRTLAVFSSLALLCLQDGVAAESKAFALDGTAIQLAPEYPLARLRIPVIPIVAVHGEKPLISVTNVRFGNRVDEKLRTAFHNPSWEDDSLQAITLQVDTSSIEKSGIYELTLLLQPAKAESTFKPEWFKASVVVPEARLRPIEKLIINRTWKFIGWHEDSGVPFPLEETTQNAYVTNVRLRPSRLATFANTQVTGSLILFTTNDHKPIDEVNVVIPPGGKLTFDYQVTNEFPLGIVTGSLEINAPQLSAPLLVPFEVHSRLARGYILLFVAVGLFTSYLVKVRLQNAVQLGQARLQAIDLERRVQAEIERHHDDHFHEAIRVKHQALKIQLTRKDATALVQAANELDATLREALADLMKRRDTVQANLDEFRTVTDNEWPIPKVIGSAIASARIEVQKAAAVLQIDNIDEAARLLLTGRASLAGALIKLLPAWQRDVITCFESIAAADVGIGKSVQAAFIESFNAVRNGLGVASLDDPNVATSGVLQLLPNIAKERRIAEDLALRLSRTIESEADTQAAGLKKFNLPDPAAVNKLCEQVDAASMLIKSIPHDPETTLQSLPSNLRTVQTSWAEALTRQVPSAARQTIEDYVKQRDYSQAVAAVRTLLSAAQPNVPLGGGPEQFKPAFPSATAVADVLPSMLAFRTGLTATITPEAWANLALRSQSEIKTAKAWQTLMLGVLVALAGYMAFNQKFVGDFVDFATIFFWAFGIDISLDTVLKLATARANSPAR